MKQSEVFTQAEGNAWFARNREHLGERDLVSEIIEAAGIKPKRLLEIGCANGWRLLKLADKYKCETWGIEPSMHAMAEARHNHLPVAQGDAANIRGVLPRWFDLVIYGFCLYLTDPEDWFQIATEGDRVLSDGGYLIVHDFDTTNARPFAQKYEHRPDVLSYHVDFAQFWLAHPYYHRIEQVIAGNERITVLRKNVTASIPVRP